MKDDPVINLATRFGPILKAAFPNEHSVTRFDVANALAEVAQSAQQAAALSAPTCSAGDKADAYQVRCLLPTGNHQWRNPMLPSELAEIRTTGKDATGIPYEVRALYAAPQPEAPAEGEQGVAWMYTKPKCFNIIRYEGERGLHIPEGFTETPLYATPQQGQEVEALGEALFKLSDRLRSSHWIEDPENHAAYEAVVRAFQKLSPTAAGESA